MERFHRIFSNGNQGLKYFLDREGIKHDHEVSILGETVVLLIAESDVQWPKLAKYLTKDEDLVHTIELHFSKEDVREAEYCELGTTGHFGFPQPERDFGYLNVTYDPAKGCRACGIGLEQVAPFRFQKEPTQRHSHLVQLNWVFDEFFVSERAKVDLVSSGLTGFHFMPAVSHKTGEPLDGWHQLRVDHLAAGTVDIASFKSEKCTACGSTKFNHSSDRQVRLRIERSDLPDILKTREWFGSGRSAWRSTLVSKNFADLVLNRKWRGVNLAPVEVCHQ